MSGATYAADMCPTCHRDGPGGWQECGLCATIERLTEALRFKDGAVSRLTADKRELEKDAEQSRAWYETAASQRDSALAELAKYQAVLDMNNEQAVHAVARQLVRDTSGGICDENYPAECDMCDCFHSTAAGFALEQGFARNAIAALAALVNPGRD